MEFVRDLFLCPSFFNDYVELSHIINVSKVRCHMVGKLANNFSVCPNANVLNGLLVMCRYVDHTHRIVYSPTKSVCMHKKSQSF